MPLTFSLENVRFLVIQNGNIYIENTEETINSKLSKEEIILKNSDSNDLKHFLDRERTSIDTVNSSFRYLYSVRPHNYKISAELNIFILNHDVRVPKMIKHRLQSGVCVWEAAVGYHREINVHHNYSTTNHIEAQEIALDFFSSALVGCLMKGVSIKSGHIKKAFMIMQKWPNFNSGSEKVKEAINLVKDVLFQHYNVTCETEEEEIPSKPYEISLAKSRCASGTLKERWLYLVSKTKKEVLLEVDILKKLIDIFLEEKEEFTKNVWMQIFPILFTDTEMGKWVMEVVYHKKLIVNFHQIMKGTAGYDVSDDVAHNHDNDKYFPFQLVAYALKWYYDDSV